jgi:PAS domain S-box-containing protein
VPRSPLPALDRARASLPRGRTLPDVTWARRHRGIVWLVWLHAVGLVGIALLRGFPLPHALLEGGIVAVFALAARFGDRRARSASAAFGLLTASAVLVHVTGGPIEAHFHFFVVVTILSLYEDWLPFSVAVLFVLLQHGLWAVAGDHSALGHLDHPWRWAAIHAGYIAALSVADGVVWRAAEGERARTRAALERAERSEQQHRAIVESLAEGILLLGPEGAVLTANRSAEAILGVAPGALTGRTIEELFATGRLDDGTPVPPSEHPAEHARRLGRSATGVGILFGLNGGRTAWLRIAARPLQGGAGPCTVVCSFADVSAQRESAHALTRANAELERHAAELQRSNAELEQFASVASHDLAEPLRMVSSYLQLLRRRYHGALDQDADDFIDYAVGGAERMRDLIDDLLTYSRAGRSGVPPQAVDTGALLAQTTRLLEAAIADAGARIELAPGLPTVVGDPGSLGQLFQNLLANACKFRAPDRAPVVRVSVAEEPGGGWCFRVFKMFQRLHSAEDYDGTGIGLAVCRKIVERHGGRIWIEQTPGGGATFAFTLPAAERRFAPAGAGPRAAVPA